MNEQMSWLAKATLCELLALGFRAPTVELAGILLEGEYALACKEALAAAGVVSCEASTLKQFIGEYLVDWIDDFVHAVQKKSMQAFYQSQAALVQGTLRALGSADT